MTPDSQLKMPLEKQVTSLELSKKLKALGVKQESLFYWIQTYNSTEPAILNHAMVRTNDIRGDLYTVSVPDNAYSAYTVAELGELLPWKLKASWKEKDETGLGGTWDTSINTKLEIEFDEGMCVVRYALLTSKKAKTEADARALMLIYLIEHSLIQL